MESSVQISFPESKQITLTMHLFMPVANSVVSVIQFIDCYSLHFLFHSINLSISERQSVLSYLQRKGYIRTCYMYVINTLIINKCITFNPFILITELYELLKSLPFEKNYIFLLTPDHVIYFTWTFWTTNSTN